jgi:hypothetical protein
MDERDEQADPGQGNPPTPQANKSNEPTSPAGGQQPASIVLDPEVKARFAADAEYIRANVGDARTHILNTGNRLITVKEQIRHGQWLPWLKAEFDWGEQTARNYMNVAWAVTKNPTVGDLADLSITAAALYVLTTHTAPPGALEQAVDQARSGEHIGLDQARDIIDEVSHDHPAAGSQADADPSGTEANAPQPDADSDPSEDEAKQPTAPAPTSPKASPRTPRHKRTPRSKCTALHTALFNTARGLDLEAVNLTTNRDKHHLADQLHPTIEILCKLEDRLRAAGST